jgi:hypothetical protein
VAAVTEHRLVAQPKMIEQSGDRGSHPTLQLAPDDIAERPEARHLVASRQFAGIELPA